ncbi:MAG: hypothetical protein ACFFEE_10995, partial [Candidatus Thorarchaeota archaeon]
MATSSRSKHLRFVVAVFLVSSMMITSMAPVVEASAQDHGLRTSWIQEHPTFNSLKYDEQVGDVDEGQYSVSFLACDIYSYAPAQPDYNKLNVRIGINSEILAEYNYTEGDDYYYVDEVSLEVLETYNEDHTALEAHNKATNNFHEYEDAYLGGGDFAALAGTAYKYIKFMSGFQKTASKIFKPIKRATFLA